MPYVGESIESRGGKQKGGKYDIAELQVRDDRAQSSIVLLKIQFNKCKI